MPDLYILLCVLKAYKSTLQRLIIIPCSANNTLYQFDTLLQLEYQFSYHGQSTVCGILGAVHSKCCLNSLILLLLLHTRSSLVPRPLPTRGEGPGTHRLRMRHFIRRFSVKLSVYYSLPRDNSIACSNFSPRWEGPGDEANTRSYYI